MKNSASISVLLIVLLVYVADASDQDLIKVRNESSGPIYVAVAYNWHNGGLDWTETGDSGIRGFWNVKPGQEIIAFHWSGNIYGGGNMLGLWIRIKPEGEKEWKPKSKDWIVLSSADLEGKSIKCWRKSFEGETVVGAVANFSEEICNGSNVQVGPKVAKSLQNGNTLTFIKTNLTGKGPKRFVYH